MSPVHANLNVLICLTSAAFYLACTEPKGVVAPTSFSYWESLGNAATGNGLSGRAAEVFCISIKLDRNDVPFVLWADDSTGKNQVYLSRWVTDHFEGLGGSDVGSGLSIAAGNANRALTCPGEVNFDLANRPYVTWMNVSATAQSVYVKRWSNNAWEELSGSATGLGISTDSSWWPRIVIDELDRPFVAWDMFSEIFAKRYNGTSWVGLAGSDVGSGLSNSGQNSTGVSLALGANNDVFAAWSRVVNAPAGTVAYVRKWNGTAWADVSGSSTGNGLSAAGADGSRVVVVDNKTSRPYVAWQQAVGQTDEIHVRRFNGTTWDNLGSPVPLNMTAVHPAIRIDASGEPVMAFVGKDSIGFNIHVVRYTGGAWVSLDPEASIGGISNATLDSSYPDIAVASDGTLYVTWHQDTPTGIRLYVKRTAKGGTPAERGAYAVGVSCESLVGRSFVFEGMLFLLWVRKRRVR